MKKIALSLVGLCMASSAFAGQITAKCWEHHGKGNSEETFAGLYVGEVPKNSILKMASGFHEGHFYKLETGHHHCGGKKDKLLAVGKTMGTIEVSALIKEMVEAPADACQAQGQAQSQSQSQSQQQAQQDNKCSAPKMIEQDVVKIYALPAAASYAGKCEEAPAEQCDKTQASAQCAAPAQQSQEQQASAQCAAPAQQAQEQQASAQCAAPAQQSQEQQASAQCAAPAQQAQEQQASAQCAAPAQQSQEQQAQDQACAQDQAQAQAAAAAPDHVYVTLYDKNHPHIERMSTHLELGQTKTLSFSRHFIKHPTHVTCEVSYMAE